MDNITIARLLDETAALLEIDGGDPFRIRSYRRAAEAVEQQTSQLAAIAASDPNQLLEISAIGKGMAANICSLIKTGSIAIRDELLNKYRPTMLQLLHLPGMGPKTVALLWSALGIADIDSLEAAARDGKLAGLPRLGEKFVSRLLKGIEDYRHSSGRFRIDQAQEFADRISVLIQKYPGVEKVTAAGSLRRSRETVGDLDLLVTGPACEPEFVSGAVEYVASLPLVDKLLAKGQNKVSFTLRNNLQVDVRLLPRSSYGAALQYFTGSKHHNVVLRQRAIKRGLTLSEYALLRLADNTIIAAATEEEIYNQLELAYIPPELRENCGEIEAAAASFSQSPGGLPQLIELTDIHGDLHTHTNVTDGRDTIRQMAEAALARGLRYIAITDHSKNLAMTNGLDDERALNHVNHIREVDAELCGEYDGRIRVLAGIEVDILADGSIDLADSTLSKMDIVIASVHSHFNQPIDEMTARIIRAMENPFVRILGHPTGRKLLKRDPYAIHIEQVLEKAATLGVAVEHNASPARADLCDLHLRLAKQLGCKIVVNTDAHSTEELDQLRFGVRQLRRAWLRAADVLNTASDAPALLAGLRPR